MQILRGELDAFDFWEKVNSEDSAYWPVLGIDLNGVLDKCGDWQGFVQHWPVREGALDFVLRVRPHFGTLYCFTATMPIQFAAEWLTLNGFDTLFDYVSNWKLPGIYLDDNAIPFNGDFNQAYLDIVKHKPHWRK